MDLLKICAITTNIKKYTSIIKKKENTHEKIVLLAKSKLNSAEVLISKDLINLNISHDEFVLIKNVLEDYNDMKIMMKRNIQKYKDLIVLWSKLRNSLLKILVYL